MFPLALIINICICLSCLHIYVCAREKQAFIWKSSTLGVNYEGFSSPFLSAGRLWKWRRLGSYCDLQIHYEIIVINSKSETCRNRKKYMKCFCFSCSCKERSEKATGCTPITEYVPTADTRLIIELSIIYECQSLINLLLSIGLWMCNLGTF